MNDLSTVLDEMIKCGEALTNTAKALKEFYSSTNKEVAPEPKKPTKKAKDPEPATEMAEPEAKTYSKEDVRALLSTKAKEAGCKYKNEVKALVSKYSTDGTLTSVPEDKYPDLVAELEVVGNE